jgi:hypothetical protein
MLENLKNIFVDKQSSLFITIVNDGEKKFYWIDPKGAKAFCASKFLNLPRLLENCQNFSIPTYNKLFPN